MNADTNFYRIALEEYQEKHPSKRRAVDLMCDSSARAEILSRAQELKCQNKK